MNLDRSVGLQFHAFSFISNAPLGAGSIKSSPMKKVIILICFLPLFCFGQDQITLLDGKTYDVKITKQNSLNIYFYNLSDSLQTKKVILKEMLLSYQIAGKSIEQKIVSAGDELIIAKNHWYLGLGIEVIGGAIIGFSLSSPKDTRNVLMIIGGAASLTGLVLMIESWSHIGKSGQLMNRDKLSITLNNGIGLRYRM